MKKYIHTVSTLNSRSQARRLLSLGHKVGVIGQAETAALKKAGNNRNTLFERKLLHLWTAATWELSSFLS